MPDLQSCGLALGRLSAIVLSLLGAAAAEVLGREDQLGSLLEPRPDARPKVAIVIDDLGLDWERFETANALPVPVTLAFLPYGRDAQAMLDGTASRHEAILHLPMEPKRRKHDAGPRMVRPGPPAAVRHALQANLARLSGYRGVNNHTGSKVTEDARAMAVVLEELSRRGLYFLDSRTTPKAAAPSLAASTGAVVVGGDLFLDGDFGRGGAAHVRRQLDRLRAIAERRGSAIGIGHPYPATLDVLSSWTQEQAGIRFVTTAELAAEARARRGDP